MGVFSRPAFLASEDFCSLLSSLFAALDEFGEGRTSLDIAEFNPTASLVFPCAVLWEQPCVRASSAGVLLAAGLEGMELNL